MMNRLGCSDEASLKSVTVDEGTITRVTSVWLIFFLNIIVVGTVNGLYVWSTLLDLASDDRLWIQLSFALFSSLWIVVLRRRLPSQIKESSYGVWLFICLNAMNSVLIPCAVTALSTPSCYQVSILVFWSSDLADFSRCLQRLLVPPDEISSSYSYQYCAYYLRKFDGSIECLITNAALMDVLKITPPFFYSYQCGSTLLTSYIPVHMYSISLQILLTIVSLIIILSSSDRAQHPRWLLSLFPGVCWPTHWKRVGSSIVSQRQPVMIKPHQIISRTMNNIILLVSFGLCSPVLCVCVAVSIFVHICSWLMLIGRFVSRRIDALRALRSSPSTDAGSRVSLSFLSDLFASPLSLIAESPNDDRKTIDDPLLHLLDQQLQGVHSSILVCKWPVTLMSCFFLTLLCWDMAGDRGGWLQAVWVPIVGVVMAMAIWVCDRVLVTGMPSQSWFRDVFSLFFSCTSLCPNHRQSSPLRLRTELVSLASLHQSATKEMGTKSQSNL
jgi:hypothetical protein